MGSSPPTHVVLVLSWLEIAGFVVAFFPCFVLLVVVVVVDCAVGSLLVLVVCVRYFSVYACSICIDFLERF